MSLSVALALAVLTLLMVVNGETLAPMERQADAIKAQSEINDMILAQYAGVWAREGDMFLNAGTGEQHAPSPATSGSNCAT